MRDPNFPNRPDCPDFWRLSEILCRLDDKASGGEEPFRDHVPSIIDKRVLSYVARQRALRVVAMMERGMVMRGQPRMCGPVQDLLINWLATSWVDGAVMMATFERERPSRQP